ncbi:FAD-dependent oxidoreductase, partial [Aquiflexum sp.]|uniref:hydroxysqualene dehydroxylase n=1 Tax=Aquiflexum sp. TaxID=1872584 RepID=UPI0035941468
MKKVIIIGGGVAGMSAAHELVERGFEVEVYEKKKVYVGGKARSVNVKGTNLLHKDKYLPGEHGFRFFPGFYKHVTDTMKRIPYSDQNGQSNKNGVFDNLTHTTRIELTRYDLPPITILANFPKSLSDLKLLVRDMFGGIHTGLTKEEEHFFVHKVWQMMTSSKERKDQEYEKISWWKFLEADRFSDVYRHLLVQGLTRTLVAARAEIASMKTGSSITLQLMYNMLNPGVNVDRVLNGPTNEKWLNPWYDYLTKSGVKYFKGHEGISFALKKDNTIDHVIVRDSNGVEIEVTGDYYILSTPIEKAAKLIDKKMVALDDQFQFLDQLANDTAWMNGIQYYLNEDVALAHGHVCHSYTEWALTSISQVQFWEGYDLSERYNGKVKGILSVDISDWLYTRYKSIEDPESQPILAENCTPDEVQKLVWEQLKRSVNVDGKEILRDDMIEFWYLDRDIKWI